MGVAQVGFSSEAPFSHTLGSMFSWFVREIVRQDWILGFVMILGLGWALIRHSIKDLLFLTYVIVVLWFFSNWGFRYLHDVLALLPLLCLWGADMIFTLVFRKRYPTVVGAMVILSVTVPSLYRAISENQRKNIIDTRIEARKWVESHVSSGKKIAVDWAVLSVPIPSKLPWMLQNRIARGYYETHFSEEFRDAVSKSIPEPTYDVSSIKMALEEPLWPQSMPDSIRERAKKREVFLDLYRNFHFKSLLELKKEGIDYVVISSYAYAHFLRDGEPGKEHMFDIGTLDEHDKSIRHSDHFIDDDRHGFLFFLVEEGRSFYKPLLDNVSSDAKLIQEFFPKDGQLGPIIKIYGLVK